MRIYILWDYDRNDDRTIAVFEHRKDAEEMKSELEQDPLHGWLSIIEHEVRQ